MIDTCDSSVAGWAEDGLSFFIRNVQVLSSTYLPQYFKHNQFSSFVRQLNFYGFRKEKNDLVKIADPAKCDELRWHFRHEHFVREKPEYLSKILRKMPNKSNKTKDNEFIESKVGSNDESQQKNKDVESLKNEIASLENKLSTMESNIDQLSKTLRLLNLDRKGNHKNDLTSGKLMVNNNNGESINNSKRLKVINTCNNNEQKKEEFSSKIEVSTKHESKCIISEQSVKTVVGSNHIASIDLPDLSNASDTELGIKDITPLSRSSSISRSIDESQNKNVLDLSEISTTQESVDDVFAAIENSINDTINYVSTEDEITTPDAQCLPDFSPSLGKMDRKQNLHQNINKVSPKGHVHQLLQSLTAAQRKLFVNKVLADAAPMNSFYDHGSFHATDLIDALKRMISLEDRFEKELITKIGCDENKKSTCVKIEF